MQSFNTISVLEIVGNFFKKFLKAKLLLACLVVGCFLWACGVFDAAKSGSRVPVFLFAQAAPDGKTIGAVVPSGLVAEKGGLDKVVKALPPNSKFDVVQFGKILGQFQVSALDSSDTLASIAIFKIQASTDTSDRLWQQPNLVIVPSTPTLEVDARSYQFTCPKKIQPLVLSKSRDLFAKLGADPGRLQAVSLASMVCLDIDNDGQPEIVAGLRLDNPNRPTNMDPQAWQKFLSLSAPDRQEYSILALLRPIETQTGDRIDRSDRKGEWQAESIINHTRALAFVGDSIGSYALFGAQDLNGDRRLELIVQEIGLDAIDALVITTPEPGKWQNYYQSDRALNIVQ